MININTFKKYFNWEKDWNLFLTIFYNISNKQPDIKINNSIYIPYKIYNTFIAYCINGINSDISLEKLIIKILEVEEYNLRIEQYIFEKII